MTVLTETASTMVWWRKFRCFIEVKMLKCRGYRIQTETI